MGSRVLAVMLLTLPACGGAQAGSSAQGDASHEEAARPVRLPSHDESAGGEVHSLVAADADGADAVAPPPVEPPPN